MRTSFTLVISALLSVGTAPLLFAAPLTGEQLEVQDCSGAVRASSKLELGLQSRVVVKFEHSPTSKVELKSSTTDKLIEANADGLVVAFDQVGAGVWKVCPAQSAQPIEWISISQSSASSMLTTPVVIGGSLLGGGIAVMGLSSSSDAKSNSGEPSSILLSGNPKSESGLEAAAASQESAVVECINNKTPDPISGFF